MSGDTEEPCGHTVGLMVCAKPKNHHADSLKGESNFHETAGGTEFTHSGKVGLGRVGSDVIPGGTCPECGKEDPR